MLNLNNTQKLNLNSKTTNAHL